VRVCVCVCVHTYIVLPKNVFQWLLSPNTGKRAVFLSIHGGAGTSKSSNTLLKFATPSIVLCYILPTTHKGTTNAHTVCGCV